MNPASVQIGDIVQKRPDRNSAKSKRKKTQQQIFLKRAKVSNYIFKINIAQNS